MTSVAKNDRRLTERRSAGVDGRKIGRSLAASAENPSVVCGRLTPLRSDSLPPDLRPAWRALRVPPRGGGRLAIVEQQWMAGLDGGEDLRMRRCTRVRSPGASSASRKNVSPLASVIGPPPKRPTRSFGPCRSTRMPIGRPYSTRPRGNQRHQLAPCAHARCGSMLMRNTSAPARNRSAMTFRSDDAGPSVARIWPARRRIFLLRVTALVGALGGGGDDWNARLAAVAAARLGGFRELHGPEGCSPVSTSKKPVRSKPRARQSSVPRNGEFLVARCTYRPSGPFAVAVVSTRRCSNTSYERPAHQRLAGARGKFHQPSVPAIVSPL